MIRPTHERGGRTSSRTRVGMRWTRAASARRQSQGGSNRERCALRTTNDAGAYGKTVWSWLSLLQSSFRGDASTRPGLAASSIREATETRTNSSPGSNCVGRPVIGRAQGWRDAPPPPAAAGLDPVRSQVIGLGMRSADAERDCTGWTGQHPISGAARSWY